MPSRKKSSRRRKSTRRKKSSSGKRYYGPKRPNKSNRGLKKWFKEKWVDVCSGISTGRFKSCGRQKKSGRKYPYCRPVAAARAMPVSKRRQMCSKKRSVERKKRKGSGNRPRRVYQ